MQRMDVPRKKEIIKQYQRMKARNARVNIPVKKGSASSHDNLERTSTASSVASSHSPLIIYERSDSLYTSQGQPVANVTEQTPNRFVALLGNRCESPNQLLAFSRTDYLHHILQKYPTKSSIPTSHRIPHHTLTQRPRVRPRFY